MVMKSRKGREGKDTVIGTDILLEGASSMTNWKSQEKIGQAKIIPGYG